MRNSDNIKEGPNEKGFQGESHIQQNYIMQDQI